MSKEMSDLYLAVVAAATGKTLCTVHSMFPLMEASARKEFEKKREE